MTDTSYNPNFAPYPAWSVRQAPVPATVHNMPSSIAGSGSAYGQKANSQSVVRPAGCITAPLKSSSN